MNFYAVLPSLACLAVILMVASSPLVKFADTAPMTADRRVQTIDGLRGFLALGVFLHHSAVYHQYILTGRWAIPPSAFYANIGQAGVAVFFMITGYLFWSQILRAGGRPDFIRLYVGRIFRIFPLYFLLAVIVFIVVGVLTHWQLQISLMALLKGGISWLSGGILPAEDVNGHSDTYLIVAGVTWTLQFEWFFYASLLVTCFLARNTALSVVFPIAGFLGIGLLTIAHPTSVDASAPSKFFVGMIAIPSAASMFLMGMIAALAKSTGFLRHFNAPQWVLSSLTIVLVTLVLFFSTQVFGIVSVTLLGLAFMLVVFDRTIFGLLLTKGAKRLGDISYGIYLLQGPVLFLVFQPAAIRAAALSSPWFHWSLVMIAALALVAMATATHILIELPGIQLGRWVANKASSHKRTGKVSSPQPS